MTQWREGGLYVTRLDHAVFMSASGSLVFITPYCVRPMEIETRGFEMQINLSQIIV
jgi:hypothetical protein